MMGLCGETEGATGWAHGFNEEVKVKQGSDGLDRDGPRVGEARTVNT